MEENKNRIQLEKLQTGDKILRGSYSSTAQIPKLIKSVLSLKMVVCPFWYPIMLVSVYLGTVPLLKN